MSVKLATGQFLYREFRRRRHPETEVEQVLVTCVGAKYFSVNGDETYRYLKDTLKSESGVEQLYKTEQEIRDIWARTILARKLSNVFNYTHVPLPILEKIAEFVPEQLNVLAEHSQE